MKKEIFKNFDDPTFVDKEGRLKKRLKEFVLTDNMLKTLDDGGEVILCALMTAQDKHSRDLYQVTNTVNNHMKYVNLVNLRTGKNMGLVPYAHVPILRYISNKRDWVDSYTPYGIAKVYIKVKSDETSHNEDVLRFRYFAKGSAVDDDRIPNIWG